ncbi:HisA/HisF family protein [Methanothermobacter sp. KEPCO-1]|uniref:Phosphoribosylformimino-5-aminoimidazole carboxamide ribonucleotide isomerase related protein n=1 Tax=Methanothermobacter marburgensis (strain ATCC BAA-927 / DSM 2133 / JCM 14651 / NBRC 100331 / OCM 82 / Marburg) TaxID=79929 RepID=D9PWP7_METTM|nr:MULTISPECIES: HisA/HisF family protein [Methanothermobacter]ADL58645.1 phosphoribosylformimino-5-aminoimidazole carboxamide ribonucleotide isomerase related protein [Methanothermobacter marburgensis str. Marburg]QEF95132.1 HisA/HisF family protein [Methanothermobacter sp. KEPCO-1]WBF09225.1 HisA/HisF family protein [Methanothermobacter marburgensis]
MIEVIPVIDLRGGIAVAGKSGERENYRPLETVFSSAPDPVNIALSLRAAGARSIYIADLDAIEGTGSNLDSVGRVNHVLPVTLDAGVKNRETFRFMLQFASRVVAATETLESTEELEYILKTYPPERTVVSVDVKDMKLHSENIDLELEEFRDLLLGYESDVILLDLGAVGTSSGFNRDLLELFRPIIRRVIPGGGVLPNEIPEFEAMGVRKVLVGRALHEGMVRPG